MRETHKISIPDRDSQFGITYVQSKIVTEIIKVSNDYSVRNGFNFNGVRMSITLVNIISDNTSFSTITKTLVKKGIEDNEDDLIGILSGRFNVYLDLDLNRNQVVLFTDIESIRDSKINTILNNKDEKVYEVIIDFESSLI